MPTGVRAEVQYVASRVATRVADSRELARQSRTIVAASRHIIWSSWRTLLGQRMPIGGGADDRVALTVRDRVRAGHLPVVDGKVVARLGTGRTCAVCDKAIGERQIEYAPQDPGDGRNGADGFCAHQACYTLWLVESQLAAQSRIESL